MLTQPICAAIPGIMLTDLACHSLPLLAFASSLVLNVSKHSTHRFPAADLRGRDWFAGLELAAIMMRLVSHC